MEDHPVWHHMQEHVHSTSRPMPPAGAPPLTPAELATLDAWFAAGAPPGNQLCSQ
jgi:hypothetical protein